jgi:single-stranded DNA-binding protein
MGDTNYVGSIVKILENPIQKLLTDTVVRTEFRVQIPQVRNRKSKIVKVVCWGNLARDVKNYYRVNDYIMIEGYLSLRDKMKSTNRLGKQNLKQVQITVLKTYFIKNG